MGSTLRQQSTGTLADVSAAANECSCVCLQGIPASLGREQREATQRLVVIDASTTRPPWVNRALLQPSAATRLARCMLAAGEENMLSTALRCCQGSAYAQGCTHICLLARLSAVAHSINLPAGFNAVLDPACAAARPRRERAAAHSGDIMRPSCASESVR